MKKKGYKFVAYSVAFLAYLKTSFQLRRQGLYNPEWRNDYEWFIRKIVEGSRRLLLQGNILLFASRNCAAPKESAVKVTRTRVEIRTRNFLNRQPLVLLHSIITVLICKAWVNQQKFQSKYPKLDSRLQTGMNQECQQLHGDIRSLPTNPPS
jgi:hypothetical protein